MTNKTPIREQKYIIDWDQPIFRLLPFVLLAIIVNVWVLYFLGNQIVPEQGVASDSQVLKVLATYVLLYLINVATCHWAFGGLETHKTVVLVAINLCTFLPVTLVTALLLLLMIIP